MSRIAAAFIVLLGAGGSAYAMEVLNAGSMSCSRLQAAVQSAGRAAVRSTSTQVQGLPLSGTYVASSQFCNVGQTTVRRSVRSADSASCALKQCQPRNRGTR